MNNKLIEEINDAFVTIMEQEKHDKYKKYIKHINEEIINNIDDLDANKLNMIVSSNLPDMEDSILMFTILNAITAILNNKKLTRKEELDLKPIITILAIYKLTQPKQFVSRIHKVINSPDNALSKNELNTKKILKSYFKQNEKAIKSAINKTNNDLIRTNKKYANNITKAIRKDIAKGVTDKKSIYDIEKSLKNKYKVKENVIQRNLDTELHAQAETVKLEFSKQAGFTHKTWKTKEDSKVRKTKWHIYVANKRIPIDSDFVGAGLKASRPGDPRLPAGERIRCRCYLIYD